MRKMSKTSPLVPLASNELFERPPIVTRHASNFCCKEREARPVMSGFVPTNHLNCHERRASYGRDKPRAGLLFLKSDARERLS